MAGAAHHLTPDRVGLRVPAGRQRRNAGVVFALLTVIAGMGALVYCAVPLYQLFCRVMGFGSTIQVAKEAPDAVAAQQVKARFDAKVVPDLPWRIIAPEPVEVRLGEERLVAYQATNLSDEPILGTLTFNVTPHKAGPFFSKVACFCFTEQLMPGRARRSR
jgi:cytochrome c oxidase assembly protein subunit 11